MTYRNIETSIWKDEWFADLDPQEKLLFIYLFSNESAMLTGLYKITLRVIEFETGLPKEFIVNTLNKFSQANKVHYDNGVIWVVNLRKYNDSKSPTVAKRIQWELGKITDCQLKRAYLGTGDTVPIQYPYSMDTHLTVQTLTSKHAVDTVSPERPAEPTNKQPSPFDDMRLLVERLTGYPIPTTKQDMDALNEFVRLGVTEADIRGAIAYFSGNGYVARGPDKLLKSVKTEVARRTQADSGKSNVKKFIPEEHASEVY